jgi:hypothetical protein
MTQIEERELLAKLDQMHADVALKQEQLSQMKTFPLERFEGWKLMFAGMTAFAVTFVAGATAGVSTVYNVLHWMGRLS